MIVAAPLGCGKQRRHHAEALDKCGEGDFAAAASIYRTILESDPENAFFLNNTGWALFRNGDVEVARKYLTEALANCSGSRLESAIRTNLRMVEVFRDARGLMEGSDFEAALPKLDTLLEEYGATELAMKHKALCLEKLGRPKDAVTLWKKLLKRYKNKAFETHYVQLAKQRLGL